MKDLTKGKPYKVLIFFALPILMSNIFQKIYNITDSKIVSLFISPDSLAAVGSTAIVSNSLNSFLVGLTQGFSILVAKHFGAKNEDGIRKSIASSIVLTSIMTTILVTIGMVGADYFLMGLNTPSEIKESAGIYLKIIILGLIFNGIFNLCANVIRAMGDSVKPLICLAISLVTNIGIDVLFVVFLNMGVAGAAYATIISQAVAAFLALGLLITKYHQFLPKASDWKYEKDLYNTIFSQGISMGLMIFLANMGTIFLQSSINKLGTIYITAQTSARRMFDIMLDFIYVVPMAMSTFASQNLGANKKKRILQGFKQAVLINTCLTSIILVISFLTAENIVSWIASSDDPTIVKCGVQYIRVGAVFMYVVGPLFTLRFTLQGLGKRIIPILSSTIELVTKIVFAFVLVPWLGFTGISFTEPVSWCIMIIPLLFVYKGVYKEFSTEYDV